MNVERSPRASACRPGRHVRPPRRSRVCPTVSIDSPRALGGAVTPGRPLVSVVTPVYNAERHLAEALESVLGQTLADFELVVLDDGSTDCSPDVIRRFAQRDRRIVARFGARRGVAAARNECVEVARAELLAVMDADDVAEPNRLEVQLAYLERHPACVALGGQMLYVDEAGDPLWPSQLPLDHDTIDARLMAGHGGALANPTAMLRRVAVLKVGGYRRDFQFGAEDFDLLLRLAEVGQLANVSDRLVRYRLHPESLSARCAAGQFEEMVDAIRSASARRGVAYRGPAVSRPLARRQVDDLVHRAMKAREHGYTRTARKYATRALVRFPVEFTSWRTAAVVFLGSRLRAMRSRRNAARQQ